MGDFLKVFVRGIVVTVLLPFILAFLVLYAVYLTVVYAIMLVRNLVVFFMGGSIDAMKEDVKAKQILADQKNVENNMTNMLADLMHSAIQQNPEAVRAMAQQQIAAQQAQPQPAPAPTPVAEIPETIDVKPEEGGNND